ncbi:unnamed protein product [Schistosoma curassoni]|uniref:Ras family protein n=1 Tax=Schistosoma curassoni TaxID=6186 RepID=A0A183JD40_9TREM|nr:unnamed protein product [Schistosoma curassoni]
MSYTYSLTIHIGHSWSKYNLRQARSGSTGHILDQNNKKKDQEDTVQRRGTRQRINPTATLTENAGKQIPIAIIGNKKDLKEQKEWQGNKCVSYAIGSKLAQEIGALFFETSALTGENVNECVEALARLLCAQEDYNLRCPQLKLSSDTPRQTNPKCCVR